MVKAILKNYRQSPQKVRLVANTVRGKKVGTALTKLTFTTSKSALPIKKLIESAVANASHNHGMETDDLFIKSIVVDEGFTMKRWRPRARGAAFPIRKRTSKVTVILDTKDGKVKKAKKNKSKKATAKTTAKKASKSAKVVKTEDKAPTPRAPRVEEKAGGARDQHSAKTAPNVRTTNK